MAKMEPMKLCVQIDRLKRNETFKAGSKLSCEGLKTELSTVKALKTKRGRVYPVTYQSALRKTNAARKHLFKMCSFCCNGSKALKRF